MQGGFLPTPIQMVAMARTIRGEEAAWGRDGGFELSEQQGLSRGDRKRGDEWEDRRQDRTGRRGVCGCVMMLV